MYWSVWIPAETGLYNQDTEKQQRVWLSTISIRYWQIYSTAWCWIINEVKTASVTSDNRPLGDVVYCLLPDMYIVATRCRIPTSAFTAKLKKMYPYCKHKWPPGQSSRVEFGKVFSMISVKPSVPGGLYVYSTDTLFWVRLYVGYNLVNRQCCLLVPSFCQYLTDMTSCNNTVHFVSRRTACHMHHNVNDITSWVLHMFLVNFEVEI
jgi:hypothetical protein